MKHAFICGGILCFFFAATLPAASEGTHPEDETQSRTFSQHYEEVIACPLGKKGEYTVRILRKQAHSKDSKFYVYYKQFNGGSIERIKNYVESPYVSFAENEGRSMLLWGQISCVGKKEKVFVLVTEPSVGRQLHSTAWRYHSGHKELQMLGGTTDDPATHVCIGKDAFWIIGDTTEYDEDKTKRYKAAKYSRKAESTVDSFMNEYPKNCTLIPIKPQLIIDVDKTPPLQRQ